MNNANLIKNIQDYVPILLVGKHANLSRNVYIHKSQLKNWQALERDRTKNFYCANMFNNIYRLGGVADQRDHRKHTKEYDGMEITYRFDSKGDVYLQNLTLTPENQVKQQQPGVYPVKFKWDDEKREDDWQTDDDCINNPDLGHTLEGTARVAVGGKQFKTKEATGKVLIEHITKAYSLHESRTNSVGSRYSLVWLDNDFVSDKSVTLVSDVIFNTAAQGAYLDWLVHGNACETFKKVMQNLPNYTKLPSAKNMAEALSNQRVFFSKPRGNVKEAELKKLCKASGLTYHGTRLDAYDWKNKDARGKVYNAFGSAIGKFASKDRIITGAAVYMGFPYVQKFLDASTPMQKVALGIGATAIVWSAGKTTWGYVRNAPKAWRSTLGKGHLHWD